MEKNYSGRSKQDNNLLGIHSKFIFLLFLHKFSGFDEQLKQYGKIKGLRQRPCHLHHIPAWDVLEHQGPSAPFLEGSKMNFKFFYDLPL